MCPENDPQSCEPWYQACHRLFEAAPALPQRADSLPLGRVYRSSTGLEYHTELRGRSFVFAIPPTMRNAAFTAARATNLIRALRGWRASQRAQGSD